MKEMGICHCTRSNPPSKDDDSHHTDQNTNKLLQPATKDNSTLHQFNYNSFWKTVINNYCFEQNINIPSDIISLVALYMVPMEYFTKCGQNLAINNEHELVSVSGYDVNTAIGAMCILSTVPCIYKWFIDIKIQNSMMTIGIACKFNKLNSGFHLDKKSINYAYNCYSGYKCSKGDYKYYTQSCGSNDSVEIILDLYNRTLSYSINNNTPQVAYENIIVGDDVKYNFCLAMRGEAVDGAGIDNTKNKLILKRFEKWIY
eukprot:497508_1